MTYFTEQLDASPPSPRLLRILRPHRFLLPPSRLSLAQPGRPTVNLSQARLL